MLLVTHTHREQWACQRTRRFINIVRRKYAFKVNVVPKAPVYVLSHLSPMIRWSTRSQIFTGDTAHNAIAGVYIRLLPWFSCTNHWIGSVKRQVERIPIAVVMAVKLKGNDYTSNRGRKSSNSVSRHLPSSLLPVRNVLLLVLLRSFQAKYTPIRVEMTRNPKRTM